MCARIFLVTCEMLEGVLCISFRQAGWVYSEALSICTLHAKYSTLLYFWPHFLILFNSFSVLAPLSPDLLDSFLSTPLSLAS